MKRALLFITCLAVIPAVSSADVLTFKDGSTMKGQVVSQANGTVVFKTENLGELSVPQDKIAGIQLGDAAVPAAAPAKPAAKITATKSWDGWYYVKIPLGLPPTTLGKLVPAVQGAATARGLQAYPITDGVQINVSKKEVIRYWTQGTSTVDAQISFGIAKNASNPDQLVAEAETRLRALHEELYRDAKARSEEAKSFESSSVPNALGGVSLDLLSRTKDRSTCDSHLDCTSGGFCKDRGDGVKLCMNKGSRGDYCTNNLECASGLWCKPRGDGLQVCK